MSLFLYFLQKISSHPQKPRFLGHLRGFVEGEKALSVGR
jgi:hypothetical protein